MRLDIPDTEYDVGKLIKIIERQGNCKCTYLKCPKCGKCQDNLNNAYVLRIYELEEEVKMYKQILKTMV